MSDYEDKGPFVMSRYLKKEDLYEAMRKRIERLEAQLAKCKEQRNEWMNAFYDDLGLIIHEKAPEADRELEALTTPTKAEDRDTKEKERG